MKYILIVQMLFMGCSSSFNHVPFANHIRGEIYSIDEFEARVVQEAISHEKFIESSSNKVSDEGENPLLSPVFIRQFPLPEDWSDLKEISKAGDQVVEYYNSAYGRPHGWGPREIWMRGFALERNGKIIGFIFTHK